MFFLTNHFETAASTAGDQLLFMTWLPDGWDTKNFGGKAGS